MKIHFLTDIKTIQQHVPRCIELAKKNNAVFPFNFLTPSVEWWKRFNNKDGSIFWQKRGTNFLGSQSTLENIYLLLVEQHGELCGFAPFVALNVLTTSGNEKQRILCYAGDPVLIPYQEITVASSNDRKITIAVLDHLVNFFLKEKFHLLFLGYHLKSSRIYPIISDYFSQIQKQEIDAQEAITSIRGGVRPWTIRQLSRRMAKVGNSAANERIVIKGLTSFCEELADCQPLKLMFPGTRNSLENKLNLILKTCRDHKSLTKAITPVEELLKDRPICYPYISLPADHDTFMSSLSRSTRYYYRRYMKAFIKMGGTFEIVEGCDIDDQDIRDYLHLHETRWGRESMFINKDSYAFHQNMTKSMATDSLFSLFFARFEGIRIAALSCFDIYPRRECYFTGMDPEYQKTRAGRLLWLHSIYDSIDKGYDTYDLGPGDFGYKMSFATDHDRSHCFLVTRKNCPNHLDQIFSGYECMIPYK